MRRKSKIFKSFVLKKWKGADPCILINGRGCWASCHSNCPEFWVITWEPRRYSQWVRISHRVCRQEWNGRNCFGRAPISAPMGRVGLLPHVHWNSWARFQAWPEWQILASLENAAFFHGLPTPGGTLNWLQKVEHRVRVQASQTGLLLSSSECLGQRWW